jgi:hypothetical protein
VKTLSEIRRFFAQNETPIYYFNTTPFNLLGAEKWIGGLQFINTIDSFAQRHASAFFPEGAAMQQPASVEAANQYLLEHPAVARFVRPGGKALFLMFDEQNEKRARTLGLQVCFPAAAFRNRLDSKVVTTELANRAGVAPVPNVLARIESYGELRRVCSALAGSGGAIALRRFGEDNVFRLQRRRFSAARPTHRRAACGQGHAAHSLPPVDHRRLCHTTLHAGGACANGAGRVRRVDALRWRLVRQ